MTIFFIFQASSLRNDQYADSILQAHFNIMTPTLSSLHQIYFRR